MGTKVIELEDIKRYYKVGTQLVKALQSITLNVEKNANIIKIAKNRFPYANFDVYFNKW